MWDGSPWSVIDNCQDFVYEPIVGHKMSPTRDAVVGTALFFGIAAAIIKSVEEKRK
jgi:hypothetical protein